MARETVDTPGSSNVLQASYDDTSRTLEVAYGDGGIYTYENVPPEVWAGFKGADSKGGYLHRHVKGRYNHRT